MNERSCLSLQRRELFTARQRYKKRRRERNNNNKNDMEKYIDLDARGKKLLMKIFKVDDAQVSAAVNFKRESKLIKEMQHVALTQLGGKIKAIVPIEECIHDYEGYMTQRFSNGATIKTNKDNGYTTITNRHGDLVKTVDVRNIDEFENWQVWTARL